MRGVVRPLPGRRCRHYLRGRCFREEHLNPGLHQSYRCGVYRRLCEAFDDHVQRSEAFGLDEAAAARIWNDRFPRLLDQTGGCRDYQPGDSDDFLGCAQAVGDVCLLAMPPCPGVCPEFVLFREPSTTG